MIPHFSDFGVVASIAVIVLGASGIPFGGSLGQARPPKHFSIDVCSRHPELFKVRPLTAEEIVMLVRPVEGTQSAKKSAEGNLISGECTKFIKTVANLVVLTNGARFAITDNALAPAPPATPGTGPVRSRFVPPRNVLSIAPDKFVEGTGRSYVQNIGTMVLWSGRAGSAIGTIRCSTGDGGPCALDRLLLSSRYKIREFGFIPAPDAESHVGSLWFWVAPQPGEQAVAGYTIEDGNHGGR